MVTAMQTKTTTTTKGSFMSAVVAAAAVRYRAEVKRAEARSGQLIKTGGNVIREQPLTAASPAQMAASDWTSYPPMK